MKFSLLPLKCLICEPAKECANHPLHGLLHSLWAGPTPLMIFSLVIKHLSDGKNICKLHRPVPAAGADLTWSHGICCCFSPLGLVLCPFPLTSSYSSNSVPVDAASGCSARSTACKWWGVFVVFPPCFDVTFCAVFLDPPVKNEGVKWGIPWICK